MTSIRNPRQECGKIPDHFRDNAAFVNIPPQQDARTKSDLVQIPSITLPKGGGALKGIDEKFSVNAVNGTAACHIPLPFSPGKNGFTPSLSLKYNSGNSNGLFGLGWAIDTAFIQRKTEKKLPEYDDANESDTFIFSGAEDLVPELIRDDQGEWVRKTSVEGNATISYYRPRIGSGFARIEKLDDQGNVYWRVRTRDNIVSVFGRSAAARLSSPVSGEEYKIFRWCLEYSYDDKGNYVRYAYKKEDLDNVAPAAAEKNRLNHTAPFTNIYLKSIRYGNTTPFYEGDPAPADFLFELLFDFGEHDALKPSTQEVAPWLLRQDPFSDFRAGFDIRCYRLCRRVLMFHHFRDELGMADYLVRSLSFGYDEHLNITYLEKVTQSGYIWEANGDLRSGRSFPPLEFSYFRPGFSREVKEIRREDLSSEGISGILSGQAGGWLYPENSGDAAFHPARIVSPLPSLQGLSRGILAIRELEADGEKYLAKANGDLRRYYKLGNGDEWKPCAAFKEFPNIDLGDPNLRFLDLNGDGMPDMLISCEQEFIWYAAQGKQGYGDYHFSAWAAEEGQGPRILFADKDQKMLIATADMSGDGLADIVLITSANVYYYPNLGYGRFGAKVTLTMKGCFDNYSSFDPACLRLGDIDGSGTTDIAYVGKEKIRVWFNQSGNSLSTPSEFFNPFPAVDDRSDISFVDLFGNGTSCLVWSSLLPGNSYAPLRYIDIMHGRKPHMLYAYKNNSGREVTLEYRSSTHYYLDDEKQGIKWITKLPFPVHCVSKVIVRDLVSQTRLTTEYSYHHGYYDAKEREFRGFARVEQKDSEEYDYFIKQMQATGTSNALEKDLYQAAVITRTWFHTGAYINRQNIFHPLQSEYYPAAQISAGSITDPLVIADIAAYIPGDRSVLPGDLAADEISECCRALQGFLLRQEVYSEEGDAQIQVHPYAISQHNYDIQLLQPRAGQRCAVFFSHEKESFVFHLERNPLDPRIAHNINIEIDPYGNVLQSVAIAYGRKRPDAALPAESDRQMQARQHIVYTQQLFTTIVDTPQAYRLPQLCESQSWELNAPPAASGYFTSGEISDLFANASVVLYEQEAAVTQKRKIGHARTLFLKNDLSGPMPLGVLDTLALPYENYLLAFTPTLAQDIYGAKYDDSLMRNKAWYMSFQNDGNYWIRSGRVYYHPALDATPDISVVPSPTPADVRFAKSNFYLPVACEDNFGSLTKIFYDPYKLFIRKIVDPAGNEVNTDAFNYRLPAPYLVRDANDNRAGIRYDELGMVTYTFVMGKENEFLGDPMDVASAELSANDQPTTVLTYDFRYFDTAGKMPNRVRSSVREKHYYHSSSVAEPDVKWQDSYVYSDGSGQVVLTKVQARPGPAPQRDAQGNLVYDASGRLLITDTAPDLRWIGNGKMVFNNKGNPVKQYEPYFDSSFEYNTEDELTMQGFTAILYYDAWGRVIRKENPNHSFSRATFDAWMKKVHDENDENDTVQESRWYQDRISGAKGAAEEDAAEKAAVHYDTRVITCVDSLGRPFLSVVQNKTCRSGEAVRAGSYCTRTALDIEGNARSITDTCGNTAMSWKYDMLGNICFQHSMDAGDRWMLTDVAGRALRLWDSRQQVFSYEYDSLHRPLRLLVNTGAGDLVFGQYAYGEDVADDKLNNLRGKLYRRYDIAGLVVNEAYDFKGNCLVATRTLLQDDKNIPDWSLAPALSTETYTEENSYDALNRLVQTVAADGSIFIPSYNAANLLNDMSVRIKGADAATAFIANIGYNAKGRREQIYSGNNATTHHEYDPEHIAWQDCSPPAAMEIPSCRTCIVPYDPVGNTL